MSESKTLQAARRQLARAEARFDAPESILNLHEGIALLDELVQSGGAEVSIARNVATAYAEKLFARVQKSIQIDRAVPQPILEHYFKMMLAFDAGYFEFPYESRAIKIAVAHRLIELLYEGYPDAQKQAALRQLSEMTR
jgi:ABC-type thiamine transport system substrate-binding protein